MLDEVTILGLDPGKTTGWGLIRVRGRNLELLKSGETKDVELVDIADIITQADIVVYEDWKTRPKKMQANAFQWDPMIAARVIGSLRTIYRLAGKQLPKLIVQQPVQKVPGYGFAGMKYQKGKKGVHQQDAVAHAVFYAVDKLGALPVSSGGS